MAHAIGTPTIRLGDSLAPSSSTPSLTLIGQNPGAQEDQPPKGALLRYQGETLKGRPFIGPVGQLLRACYIDYNTLKGHATLYLSNGVRCGPSSVDTPGPFTACLPHLLADLAHIVRVHDQARNAILICSAPVVRAFYRAVLNKHVTQKQSFSMQGFITTIDDHDVAVFSTWHPGYLMRGHDEEITTVHDHIALALHYLQGKETAPCNPLLIPPTSPP